MRLLILVFTIVFSCSAVHASFPWLDQFEESTGNWGSSASTEEAMLTAEYNVTVDTLASGSLQLRASATPVVLARVAASSEGSAFNGAVGIWFYDDGETPKAFELGITDIVTSGGSSVEATYNVAVLDTSTASATGQYHLTGDGQTTPTGIARTAGWHFAEFLTNPSGARMLLDGVETPNQRSATVLRPETVVLKSLPVDLSSGAQNKVWIDDARFRERSTPYSQDAGSWSDNFEGGLVAQWLSGFVSAGQINGDYNHTSDAGSSYSLFLGSNIFSGSIERITELPVEAPQPGKLSFWFYDDGTTTNSFFVGARVANFNAGAGKIRGANFSIGLADTPDAPLHEYLVVKDYTSTHTGIARSTGWHYVEMETTAAGLTISLDDQNLPDAFFAGYTRMTSAEFNAAFLPTGETTKVWVDDVVYERSGPPSAVKDWALYY